MSEKNFQQDIIVPVKEAEVWTKNYREDTTIEESKKKVNSFVILRETLEMVLELETTAVRAYIGINDKKQKTLLFVGAEWDEAAQVYRDVFGPNELGLNSAEEGIVYDFTEPSPPNKGDDTSPLNQ
ncbi:hypothetical protein [uncultured Flavobacterium sp.]|jgi:hypothetical protein|uniref:hypothetical protein n=1 Tax=uncultured Flavobacterium sp. TaxID=165435 RepID=UPI0030EC005C|tara:strand:+ start:2699 stop:3076 length:378 start_codon:yes stop_codon:yes gene_type:complete